MVTKRRNKRSTKFLIDDMKEKYGDAVTLIQNTDRKSGSLTIYKPDNNRMVFWMALAGLNEYEIASVLGISDKTLAVWKKMRPDFNAAMQAGRKEAVATAAHSLFRVGNGYSHEDVKLIPNRVKEYDPDTGRVTKEYTEVMRVPFTKYYPPNVQALLKFLAAKHPEIWGDRSEVMHTSQVQHSIDTTKLSKKKLKLLKQIAASGAQQVKKEGAAVLSDVQTTKHKKKHDKKEKKKHHKKKK